MPEAKEPELRPVWLFSMDSDQFYAAPTTTGGLQAYYQQYGANPDRTHFSLVHFKDSEHLEDWLSTELTNRLGELRNAVRAGINPVFGLSFYTWNAAEFLELCRTLKAACPEALIVAGGPHVQQAEDYLYDDPIDAVVLGPGEQTFQALLDQARENWASIPGLAFLEEGAIVTTEKRGRPENLDDLPSPLDVIPLTDGAGKPLYPSISLETSRGCPFKCAFCEWGTGDIGSKMLQFSMARIKRDWRRVVDAGIRDIWLADSNFGALKQDLEKAEYICELKRETGLPVSFATSWSKKHSPSVQKIVLLLNQHKLVPHYQLALQTLTPLALELSNRKNMSSNKYAPIAKAMASEGVPIAAELIWGLPGDNLPEFERNLDGLLATFPNINIFGYTLLPGTEFYRRRKEYKIDAIPVAGYGKAKGEYVVGCHTFDRDEGLEGYFLITAHIIFVHGHILPLTMRWLALSGETSVSELLRQLLDRLLVTAAGWLPEVKHEDRMDVYEKRDALFVAMISEHQRLYETLAGLMDELIPTDSKAHKLLWLDAALSPKTGQRRTYSVDFDFSANAAKKSLDSMELPEWLDHPETLLLETPGGTGEILTSADGGSWLKADIVNASEDTSPQAVVIEL